MMGISTFENDELVLRLYKLYLKEDKNDYRMLNNHPNHSNRHDVYVLNSGEHPLYNPRSHG